MCIISRQIGRGLILLFLVVTFSDARSVKPVTYGYELGDPFSNILPVVPDLEDDLTISAAEPRPVFVELVKRPLSLPLVSDVGFPSVRSDAPVISASEKIEKILRRPMAFSYNTDSAHAASALIVNSPKERLRSDSTELTFDQQPDAIDYYKYIARLQGDEKDGAGAVQKEEPKKEEQKQEEKKEEKKEDIRTAGHPNLYLSYSPSNFHHDYTHDHLYKKHEPKHKSEEIKEEKEKEKKKDDHEAHSDHHHHHHHHHHDAKPLHVEDAGNKAEASESHEEHKEESHHSDQGGHSAKHSDSQESGSGDEHKKEEVKEEVQASASHHGGGNI